MNDDIIIFRDPCKLFEFVINNDERKTHFIEEIQDIIKIMNNILYKPPYNILFGRIYIEKYKAKKPKDERENINHYFYEGLGDNFFYNK